MDYSHHTTQIDILYPQLKQALREGKFHEAEKLAAEIGLHMVNFSDWIYKTRVGKVKEGHEQT
jgi:hypothetical protein